MSIRSVSCGVFVFVVLAAGAVSAGEGVVALQTADPSCEGTPPDLYADCGNGTVTDRRTGQVWLANADCFGQLTWPEAMATVAGLSDLPSDVEGICLPEFPDSCDCGLSDGSSPGEWRLPSIEEWQAMIAWADSFSCDPKITIDSGFGCWEDGCYESEECSFYDVTSDDYWSASTAVLDPSLAAFVFLDTLSSFDFAYQAKSNSAHVWPVRGGQ